MFWVKSFFFYFREWPYEWIFSNEKNLNHSFQCKSLTIELYRQVLFYGYSFKPVNVIAFNFLSLNRCRKVIIYQSLTPNKNMILFYSHLPLGLLFHDFWQIFLHAILVLMKDFLSLPPGHTNMPPWLSLILFTIPLKIYFFYFYEVNHGNWLFTAFTNWKNAILTSNEKKKI